MSIYVTPKRAEKIFGVSENTLRRWADNGEIEIITTNGGHRRYKIPKDNKPKRKIIYARVSSQKQEKDLVRQINFLKERFSDYEVIKDIGSGINFKRKGLRTILEQLFEGNIREVVVYSKDRLARFGIELLEFLFEQFGAKLIYYNTTEDEQTPEQEFSEDIMAIISVFTARYYGSRKYKNKDL